MRAVAALATVERVSDGAEIVHAGDPGNCFYLVLEGAAVVRIAGRPDVSLSVGDYFGELALLDDARSGSVEATEDMLVARIGRSSFLTTLEREPSVALALLRTLAGSAAGERVHDHPLTTPPDRGRVAGATCAKLVAPGAVPRQDHAHD